MIMPIISSQEVEEIKALSKSERDELREKINAADPAQIFEKAGDSRNPDKREIICPICGNGKGDDHTPVEPEFENGTWLYHCFRGCGFSGDLIKIIGKTRNLNLNDFEDFCEALAVGARLTNELVPITDNPRSFKRDSSNNQHSDAELLPLIEKDIADAQAHLDDLPTSQRRGLTLDTLRHFHCGYLNKWNHPKNQLKKLNYFSRRIIIPTDDEQHYNAVALPADREGMEKRFWKQHAGSESLFNSDALNSDLIVVVEGEIDAMSIWQAADGTVAVVAVLGAGNWKNTFAPKFKALRGKEFLIVFDGTDKSNAGRNGAQILRGELGKYGIPAACRFFDDFLTADERAQFGDKSVDANEIFLTLGGERLNQLVRILIDDARADLEAAKREIPADVQDFDCEQYETCAANPEFAREQKERRCEQKNNDSVDETTQGVIPSCPVDLILPADFIFSAQGIKQIVPAKKGFKYLPVAATPIVITREFCEPTTNRVQFELAIFARKKWVRTELDGAQLNDPRQLGALGNFGAIINHTERLKQFLDALRVANPELPQVATYKATGWIDSDCTEFAYPSDNADYIVRRAGFDYEEIFKPKGNAELWKKKFVEVSEQGGTVARVAIGSVLSSCLVKPLGLPNIWTHIDGKSGIGKSALPKFAVSVFGDANPGALCRTFAATCKNRLETAAAFCDLPVILEELEANRDGSAREEKALESDIYDFSLGVANQAQRRDGTTRETKKFTGTRISTGERPLLKSNNKHGAFKRILPLHVEKLFDSKFASDLHNFCRNNRGLFGKKWIRYVRDNLAFITEKFYQVYDALKKKVPEVNDTQLKALVLAEIAYQFFLLCVGLKTLDNDLDEMNKEIVADFNAVIRTLPTDNELDDTTRAKAALQSYVAGHKKMFVQIKDKTSGTGGTEEQEEITAWGTECFGAILPNGEVAILPTALKKILENELGFASADKLLDAWKEQDLLICEAGRRTHKVTFGGMRPKTIHFKAGVIFEDAETAELDYYDQLGVM